MPTETAPVYVIGHKNPDTDSICSAIAYAELKNLLHGGGYIAARAGQINQETQYVINFFQTQPPIYVADVMTDVSDIEIRKTQGVSGQISLKKAWNTADHGQSEAAGTDHHRRYCKCLYGCV